MSRIWLWFSMDLIAYTLDDWDLTPSLRKHNIRYLVYVHTKNILVRLLLAPLTRVSIRLSLGPSGRPLNNF